ncbi:hypothetical protein FGO68_gene11981 [Halteria grandinella]|uniref:Uncharacterized protein n=1 Tax=Halteria grandinella TaxID=5974 RepID=A0A8J8NPN7_HALGN|nr:hypothetical protein FGO68_gene11981 [Halteria grandinella]
MKAIINLALNYFIHAIKSKKQIWVNLGEEVSHSSQTFKIRLGNTATDLGQIYIETGINSTLYGKNPSADLIIMRLNCKLLNLQSILRIQKPTNKEREVYDFSTHMADIVFMSHQNKAIDQKDNPNLPRYLDVKVK